MTRIHIGVVPLSLTRSSEVIDAHILNNYCTRNKQNLVRAVTLKLCTVALQLRAARGCHACMNAEAVSDIFHEIAV